MRVRSWLLVVGCVAAAGTAAGAEPGPPPAQPLPRSISCEAGFEESFGDRAKPFYTVGLELDPRAPRPVASFTRWLNDGLRPYFTRKISESSVRGELQRRGEGLAFVAPGWTIAVASAARPSDAVLLLDGKKLAGECVINHAGTPATLAVEFLRGPEFSERWGAAREALSDDYQLRYGPITKVASGDRLEVNVALRKVRSHECSSLDSSTPRLPFANVAATLRRAENATPDEQARWDLEHLELTITDASPPAVNTPSAEAIAVGLAKRYGKSTTLEARFVISTSARGIFFPGRTAGLLRADLARGVSIRADAYRQIELPTRTARYTRAHLPPHTLVGPAVAYRLALPFLGADLRERFALARSRTLERCTADYVLVAVPKRPEAALERLVLHVDRATFAVRDVQVVTPGVEYWLGLEQQRVGVTVPDADFELAVPQGFEFAAPR